jgi:hypothetical protein
VLDGPGDITAEASGWSATTPRLAEQPDLVHDDRLAIARFPS